MMTVQGSDDGACQKCGGGDAAPAARQFVYALGKVGVRFPNLGLEKEYAQIVRHADGAGLTDRQLLSRVLSKPENRYIARRVCWVMRVEGLDSYFLLPREASDLDMLIGALRESEQPGDMDVVIGELGPVVPGDFCNGLSLPVVVLDQLYALDRQSLAEAIPKPDAAEEKPFRVAASDLLSSVLALADNAGATDEHRALNYVVMRYPGVYTAIAAAFERNASLKNIEVRRSDVSTGRSVYDIIFTFVDRATDVSERFSTRVDVTDTFPFLMRKISRYYGR